MRGIPDECTKKSKDSGSLKVNLVEWRVVRFENVTMRSIWKDTDELKAEIVQDSRLGTTAIVKFMEQSIEDVIAPNTKQAG